MLQVTTFQATMLQGTETELGELIVRLETPVMKARKSPQHSDGSRLVAAEDLVQFSWPQRLVVAP
jgi:hypothetical protein